MKVIVITGVPGTGKTAIAKKLAKKLNYYYIDVNKLISKHKISKGYDRERTTKIVDIKKLNRFLVYYIVFFKKNKIIDNALIIKGLIIDSHLSHYLPRKYVDACIVAKCGIKELNKRLKKRKYSKSKIKENLQAEIFDICYSEAVERKHNVIAIDTTKGFNINDIYQKIKAKL